MQRRTFIAVAGVAATIGLAGCSDDNDVDTSSPKAVVESYYDIIDGIEEETSGEDLADELEPVLHSESPWGKSIETDMDANDTNPAEVNIDSVETEVKEEDLSLEELNNKYGYGGGDVDQSVIESIAEENAVVTAQVSYEDIEDNEVNWLTATEDGDWQIFNIALVFN